MAKVVDIERVRVERLAEDLLPAIRDAFAGPGIYKDSTADIEDVERWRRAARGEGPQGQGRAQVRGLISNG